jgi:RNA polymerase sigma factor (sigma-70 family)
MNLFSTDRIAGGTAPDEPISVVRRAQLADRESFTRLYSSYQRTVRDFLLAHGGRSFSAEDLAQEVFLRAWQDRERFSGRSSVKTYLLGIARHVWLQETAAPSPDRENAQALQKASIRICQYCAKECRLAEPETTVCRRQMEAAVIRHVAFLPRKSQ